MCKILKHNPFGKMLHIIVANIKFWKFLEPCNDQCNATLCMVKSNDLWLLWFFSYYDTVLFFVSLMEFLCCYINLFVNFVDNCWNFDVEFLVPSLSVEIIESTIIWVPWFVSFDNFMINENICWSHKPKILYVYPCHLRIECWDLWL